MVAEHLFNASPEQVRQWSAYAPERLGEALLRAVGAVPRQRGWVLPDGRRLRPAGPADFAMDLGCLKDLERKLALDRKRIAIVRDDDGWRADLVIPPNLVPYARRYRTAAFDSEVRARAILLLTFAEAQRGDVIGVVHGGGVEAPQPARRSAGPAPDARERQQQDRVP